MQEELPVLPVSHATAWLHGVVRDRLVDNRVLDDHVRLGEARLNVAHGPLRRGFTHRQPVRASLLKDRFGPLEASRFAPPGHIPAHMRIRPSLAQALKRVQHEGERFQVHPDCLHRGRRSRLVHRRDRENGLALVLGLVRQRGLAHSLRLHGQLLGPEDAQHPLHRLRRARVHTADARMRHRAQEELREDHPLGAEVLGVAGPARDLRPQIRWGDVGADYVLSHLDSPF